MSRVGRTLLLAAAVLGAGGGAALWVYTRDYSRQGEVRRAELKAARLFDWGRFHVAQFSLRSKRVSLSAECSEKTGCRLTAPIVGPTDPEAVQALLDNMATLSLAQEVARGPEAEAKLADYGLSPAPVTFTATTTDGRVHRVWIGERSPVDGRRFVAGGAPLRLGLAEEAFHWSVDRDLIAFRAKQIFELARDDIARVTITQHAVPPRALTVRRGEPLWSVSDGARTLPADPFVIDRFLVLLTRDLKADAFVTDHATEADDARYGLTQPAFVVEVETRSGRVERARVGTAPREAGAGPAEEAGQPAPYVRVDGASSIAVAYPALPTDLAKTADDFRDRRVLDYDVEAVRRVEILHAGQPPIVLEGQGQVWRMVEPRAAPVVQDRATAIALRFSKLRATRVVRDGKPADALRALELDPPQIRVVVRGEGGAVLGDLRVGKPVDAKTVHVTAEGVDRIDAVADAELRLIPLDVDAIRQR